MNSSTVIVSAITFCLGLGLGTQLVSVPSESDVLEPRRLLAPEKHPSAKAVTHEKTPLKIKPPSALASAPKEELPIKETRKETRAERVVKMRVHMVDKLVDLSPAEKEDLTDYFSDQSSDADSQSSLEEVIGEERAEFVREQQRESFSRTERESLEKDLYYFTRKFALTDEQEAEVLSTLTDIQSEVNEGRRANEGASRPERLQSMLSEIKLYRRVLRERMAKTLAQEQYEAFLKYEAESSAADMELWHEVPEETEEAS